MSAHRYALTRKSANVKTGPIPVSTTSRNSCPTACPLRGAGCYADGGPLGMYWRKLSHADATIGTDIAGFAAAIAALPDGQLWRHNQAGDMPADAAGNIDADAMAA
jgi:hypothetical protein